MQTLRFDHFFVTLQAIVDGMGFGIGAFPTLTADLELGRLVTPFRQWQVKGSAYFVLIPRDSDKPKYLREFLAWLHTAGEHAAQ